MPPTSHSFALGVVVTHIHDGHIELAKIDISVRHNNWNIGRQRDMSDMYNNSDSIHFLKMIDAIKFIIA